MHVLSVVSEFLIAAGLVHRLVLKLLVIALYKILSILGEVSLHIPH